VIGEFLGDLALLVLAPSEPGDRRVLVALPLDDRHDWYPVASSLAQFLENYLQLDGGFISEVEHTWQRMGSY
jgi:hypothetical protein